MRETEQELDELEWRLLDLEISRLKKMNASRSVLVTQQPKPKPTAKPSTRDYWQQWRSTRRNGGETLYEHRTASGAWLPFPKDRKAWPEGVRAEIEKIEAYDKQRTVGGRMISASVGGGVKLD
jgi:hypothetical protein